MKQAVAVLGVAMSSAVFPAMRARAEQFVLTDVSYTHATTTTTDSHYRVAPAAGTPVNWTSPIDYTKGSAYVRLQVKTKPSGAAPTRFQVCFEGTNSYACTSQAPVYTAPDTYEWTTPFSSFYIGNDVAVDWSKGIPKVALILKDDKNVKPAPENVGEATAKLYMPTDLSVLVGIVSAGVKFVPPAREPVADAGVRDGGVGDGGRADADAGGPGAMTDAARPAAQDASMAVRDAASSGDATSSAEDAGLDTEVDAGLTEDESGSEPEDDEASAENEKNNSGCQLTASRTERAVPWSSVGLIGLAALGYRRRKAARS